MKRNAMLVAIAIFSLVAGVSANASIQTAPEDRREVVQEQKNADESEEQRELAKKAKLTKEQAQEIALKRAPGTVESAELEREHGKLVYSFDIRNASGSIDESRSAP